MDGGDGCTTMQTYLFSGTRHLKMVTVVNFMSCIFCHNF